MKICDPTTQPKNLNIPNNVTIFLFRPLPTPSPLPPLTFYPSILLLKDMRTVPDRAS